MHSHGTAPFSLFSMNAKVNPKEFWAHLQNECNVNYYSSFKIHTASLNLCFVDKSCFIHFFQKFKSISKFHTTNRKYLKCSGLLLSPEQSGMIFFLKFLSVDVLLCMMSNFGGYQTFMYFYSQHDIFKLCRVLLSWTLTLIVFVKYYVLMGRFALMTVICIIP